MRCDYRIIELLSLTIGHVWDGEAVRRKVLISGRSLKGGAGIHCRAVRSRRVPCFIASSEPDDGAEDGHTTGDVNGSDGYTAPVPVTLTWDGSAYGATVGLRAERSESGSGRVYTIV